MAIMNVMIIGGGTAGLTAVLYLERFKRRIVLVGGGWSQAGCIALSHNIPGFATGVVENRPAVPHLAGAVKSGWSEPARSAMVMRAATSASPCWATDPMPPRRRYSLEPIRATWRNSWLAMSPCPI